LFFGKADCAATDKSFWLIYLDLYSMQKGDQLLDG